MSSLSTILQNKEKKAKLTLPTYEFKNDLEISEENKVIDLSPEDKFKNCLFIADSKICAKIRAQLESHGTIKDFKYKLFSNRSCAQLLCEFDVKNIWIDIRSSDARDWLSTYLPKNEEYTVIATYCKDKTNKWLVDLKPYVNITCKTKHLNKVRSLSFPEMADKFNDLFIHAPSNQLLGCLGLSNKLTKSQSKN
jgi:hypothetical protein